MPHVYDRPSSIEDVHLYTESTPTETYWSDEATSEYSGIYNAEIEDAVIHLKLKGYGLYEQHKAPLMHEKRITHYGPHNKSGTFIVTTVLLGGLNFIANPKVWLDNLSGWDEENNLYPKPDKRYAVKTGKTEWRALDKKKNITIDFSNLSKSMVSYTDNKDYSYSILNYITDLNTNKPVEFTISCSDCDDGNPQPQLEKLSKVIHINKDLSLTKNKIISQKKMEADEAIKREKESQELARIQKERNDPLTPAKNQCKELGFKEKTEKFAECVVKLSSNGLVNSTQGAASGDGSQDDQTCQKYGFKPNTSNYSDCRMKIDMAKQQMAQQQAQFQQQQRQYEAELKAYEDNKRKQASLKLMQFGLNMMANGGRSSASNIGPAPVAPTFVPSTNTYFLPGGHQMTCTTTGTVTNCF